MEYPKIERGYFHLLSDGWLRQDQTPFPEGRVETWAYETEQPAEDAKERICLSRTWKKPGIAAEQLDALHARFGEPILPTTSRNVTLECEI
jgi:hypothetical protein